MNYVVWHRYHNTKIFPIFPFLRVLPTTKSSFFLHFSVVYGSIGCSRTVWESGTKLSISNLASCGCAEHKEGSHLFFQSCQWTNKITWISQIASPFSSKLLPLSQHPVVIWYIPKQFSFDVLVHSTTLALGESPRLPWPSPSPLNIAPLEPSSNWQFS